MAATERTRLSCGLLSRQRLPSSLSPRGLVRSAHGVPWPVEQSKSPARVRLRAIVLARAHLRPRGLDLQSGFQEQGAAENGKTELCLTIAGTHSNTLPDNAAEAPKSTISNGLNHVAKTEIGQFVSFTGEGQHRIWTGLDAAMDHSCKVHA